MRADSRAAGVVELAAEQGGLVTSRQARVVGVTAHQLKRMADSGQLERLHHGIYRVTRFPHDKHQAQRAAWLALDPGIVSWERLDQDVPVGVLSHATAAQMQNLGDMAADTVELTAIRRIRLGIPDAVVHRGDLTRDDWEVIDGLPVTTPARTISDLAAASIDAGHLASIVRDAVADDRLTFEKVAEALSPHVFRYGYQQFDGAGFRDALIDQAGVPANAIALAEIASNSLAAQQRKAATPGPGWQRADAMSAFDATVESLERMHQVLDTTPETIKAFERLESAITRLGDELAAMTEATDQEQER
ncbi:type IV toxin-antitoxin system AbiEi family antitoxin domain-containing protein [Nocardia sp. NPDC058666]|uniref:type IV toxin-antitoxin system AbiEi family antitoxin domain-containing protein n=1 Tax=unclassified Nocardia TaxID=2637762 RepID=UPI0036520FDD